MIPQDFILVNIYVLLVANRKDEIHCISGSHTFQKVKNLIISISLD